MDWDITTFTNMTDLFAELKENIVGHVFPFIEKCADFESLAQDVVSDDYHMNNMCREVLLAEMSYMKGDKTAALNHLNDRFASQKEYSYTEHLFNENFRKLL